MKNIFVVALLTLLPALASAHTKWFSDETMPAVPASEPTTLYLTIWGIVIFVIVAIGIFLEKKKWLALNFIGPHKPHVFERAASTFTLMAGAFFIIAGTHEYLFSPNQTLESGIPMYLIGLEILVGFSFLLGIFSRLGGILLAALWGLSFTAAGVVEGLENIWVLSTALFVILMGNDYFEIISFGSLRKLVAPYKKYALSILRVGTGLTLMILGLSEKILVPELGLNFLDSHHWNFMQHLGLDYSNFLFVLSAGSVEFLLGLIFVLGSVTRLNAVATAVIFSIPLFILGPIELAGHLPHFAAVVLLLLFGNGGHLTFFSDKKKYR